MASVYIHPLELDYIFQNTLAGSPDVFFAIFMVAFSVLAGTFRMDGRVYLLLYVLASMFLYNWIGGGLFIISMFIGGLIIFYSIAKIVKS